jgi:hypothetical protein
MSSFSRTFVLISAALFALGLMACRGLHDLGGGHGSNASRLDAGTLPGMQTFMPGTNPGTASSNASPANGVAGRGPVGPVNGSSGSGQQGAGGIPSVHVPGAKVMFSMKGVQ